MTKKTFSKNNYKQPLFFCNNKLATSYSNSINVGSEYLSSQDSPFYYVLVLNVNLFQSLPWIPTLEIFIVLYHPILFFLYKRAAHKFCVLKCLLQNKVQLSIH